jgi:hypothetical protein
MAKPAQKANAERGYASVRAIGTAPSAISKHSSETMLMM